jgi:thiamine biosynthesis lipoprotein
MTPFKRVKPALGTFFEITLKNLSYDRAISLTSESFDEVYRLEKIFNVFDPSSELSRVNMAPEDTRVNLSLELHKVLEFGSQTERLSSRAFKLMPACAHTFGECYAIGADFVTRLSPCQFDLSGVAKGFIVDCIFEELRRRAPEAYVFVNAGGDLRCHGEEDIELRVPSLMDEKHFAIKNFNGALATSSIMGSLLKVGAPAAHYREFVSEDLFENKPTTVTVGAKTCMSADAVTKVLLFGRSRNLNLHAFPTNFSVSFNSFGCTL